MEPDISPRPKRIAEVAVIVLTSLLLSLLPCISPVFAIASPDSISLNTAEEFEDISVTGDMLFIGEHDVVYTVEPTGNAEGAFTLDLLDADGTTLIKTKGITDYQWKLTSIYFAPVQAASAGLTWEANYKIRIIGNPAIFASFVRGTNRSSITLSAMKYLGFSFIKKAENITYILTAAIKSKIFPLKVFVDLSPPLSSQKI